MDQTRSRSELDEKMWAVATQSEVLGVNLTYTEAISLTNKNINLSGIAIITTEAAQRQLDLQEERRGSS